MLFVFRRRLTLISSINAAVGLAADRVYQLTVRNPNRKALVRRRSFTTSIQESLKVQVTDALFIQ